MGAPEKRVRIRAYNTSAPFIVNQLLQHFARKIRRRLFFASAAVNHIIGISAVVHIIIGDILDKRKD